MVICLATALPAISNTSVVVVKGTASTPNVSEKNYSGRIADRLSEWLDDLRVPHRVLSDEDVAAGTLANAKVAILVYNPVLPARELTAIKTFVRGGGKLIVFYSTDTRLAEFMGLRIGKYKAATTRGAWSSFQFDQGPAHTPRTIYQQSWNIRPVSPLNRESKVIAWWQDAAGNRMPDPAWLETPYGYWMTHVLLLDDAENKKQMLLAMLGEWVPGIWSAAADHYMQTHSRIGSMTSIDQAVKEIESLAASTRHEKKVRPVLDQCRETYREMHTQYEQGQYPQCIISARYLRTLLAHAYGLAQKPAAHEFRGMWDHSGTGLYPGGWDATCRLLANSGFTAVFPNMLWPGAAHYPSRLVPPSETLKKYGDQMTPCIKAARKHGLEVHLWKVCWTLDQASDSLIQTYRQEGRLAYDDNGKELTWLCPSSEANRKLERDAIIEVAKKYAPDGIHLDYIRYKDSRTCFCNGCRARFEKSTGWSVQQWPVQASTGDASTLYDEWRAQNITSFVSDIRKDLHRINKKMKLSAAVFGSYPSCRTTIAQDWGKWIRDDLVDFVCPMTYSSDLSEFKALTDKHQALQGRDRIYPGIGVRANESWLDAYQTIEQIRTLRQSGAGGFMIFDLKSDVGRDILPVLSLGITADD
jgi:uncharacterized lipoprotein YddW (UPF0748 family)